MDKKGVDQGTLTMIVLILLIVIMFTVVWLRLREPLGGLGG